MTNVLVTAAENLGRRQGSERGSWVIDGNTTKKTAKKIIEGYEKGDPEVMDLCVCPLANGDNEDPVEMVVLEEIANLAVEGKPEKIEPTNDDNLLDIYEANFQEGFWDTVLQAARNV